MYGRPQRPCRWHVPHPSDHKGVDQLPYSRVSSTSFTTRAETVAQTSPVYSAKRRRLYGLNSRFDRMLQEVSWTSNSTKASRPRNKRAHSPSSSSMTNHDLLKTPTDSPNELGYGSGRTQRHFVSAMKTEKQVIAGYSPMLPEWLNNTLATLPPDDAVRRLKLPPERPESPMRNDGIDWPGNSQSPERDDSVFAFQAPVDGHHSVPVDPTETNGQPRSDSAAFRIVHYRSMEFRENSPPASLTGDVPFSTPGPRWTTPQVPARCSPVPPFSSKPIYRPSSPVTQKFKDSPQPFSTPGPFAPIQPTYGHVLDCGPVTQHYRDMACDKALPVAERNDTTSVPSFRASTSNRSDAHLCPVQCGDEQFRVLENPFSSFPKCDAPGPLSSPGFIHPTVYSGTRTEHPSSPLTPETTSAAPKDRWVAFNSSNGLSPTLRTRWSARRDTTTRKPAMFLSDIQLDQKFFRGSFPLTPPSIVPSPDDDTDTQTNFQRPHPTSSGILLPAFPMTPPLSSRRFPTDFGWALSDSHTSDVLGSSES